MSETRRLQLSVFVSVLANAAALLLAGWLWRFPPVPVVTGHPRIKLVRVALLPPPVPMPSVKIVPPLVPRPHRVKPHPLTKRRRPGARVKSSSPAPPAKAAGGSDAGAAAPPSTAPPITVIAQSQPAPLQVHNRLLPVPPIPIPLLTIGPVSLPETQIGHGILGADTTGKGIGVGEGAGTGSGHGSGHSPDAGEPFGVGKGLAGDGGPRHVVYVLDISGSMTSRIGRADAEIRRALLGLRPDETFDIIAFNVTTYLFDPDLAPATPGTVHQASVFLDTLQVNDGTNTQAAMKAALSIPDVNEIVLLTDGVPTQGITDFGSLAEYIRLWNKTHARISVVGMVGKDQDGVDRTFEATSLLQQIAHDSGGACEIVPLGYASP